MPKINIKEWTNKELPKARFVSLVATSDCNLNCKYCYEKHELRNKKVMDLSIAQRVINQYMHEEDIESVEVDFFGGEPFLAFNFIRDVVDWVHSQKWDKKHRFLISTNGTILNGEIKEWLLKNRGCINVGISLDGTKIAHDLCRSNSYDSVKKNLPFFHKYWPNQPAKMTICADTIPYIADSVIELEEMGILFTANIGFEVQAIGEANKKKFLDIYEEQLLHLVEYYDKNPHLYPVSPLLTSIPDYLGIPNFEEKNQKKIKRFCGAGHEMVVVDTDGKSYPCHRFIPWISNKSAPTGNINCQTAWKPDECSQCELIHSCPTCAGYNWEINGDTAVRTTFHCETFKREVVASCMIEWKRLRKRLRNNEITDNFEKANTKKKLDAILKLIDNVK